MSLPSIEYQICTFCEAALLEAEVGNEPVDGGLLGMAAAQVRSCQVVETVDGVVGPMAIYPPFQDLHLIS